MERYIIGVKDIIYIRAVIDLGAADSCLLELLSDPDLYLDIFSPFIHPELPIFIEDVFKLQCDGLVR